MLKNYKIAKHNDFFCEASDEPARKTEAHVNIVGDSSWHMEALTLVSHHQELTSPIGCSLHTLTHEQDAEFVTPPFHFHINATAFAFEDPNPGTFSVCLQLPFGPNPPLGLRLRIYFVAAVKHSSNQSQSFN